MVDVKQLMEEYGRTVQTLDSQWGDIRAVITDGFAPSKESTDVFFQSIELLRRSYSTMQLTAKEIVPEKAEGSHSIQTYAELIEQQQREDADRAKYREILERFVSVAAVSETFKNALEPYQLSAAALLERAEPLSETDVIGPSLFLSCLELKTFDSPEGEAFLEEIITLYPATVYHGIMFKKYYLPEDAPADREPSPPDTAQAAGKSEEKRTVQETAPSETGEEEDHKKTVEQGAAPVETEPAKGAARPATLVSAIRPIKAAAPAASAFKGDVMRIPAARTILPLFTHLGALIEPQILAFGVLMDAFEESDTLARSIHTALEKLVDKNLLAAYEMGDSGERTYSRLHCCSTGVPAAERCGIVDRSSAGLNFPISFPFVDFEHEKGDPLDADRPLAFYAISCFCCFFFSCARRHFSRPLARRWRTFSISANSSAVSSGRGTSNLPMNFR